MRLIRDVLIDATELAKAFEVERTGTSKRAVLAALSQDGFQVLVLTRLREAARRCHVPGINHVLRLCTTVLYGVEIEAGVRLGHGVNFAHTLGIVVGGTAAIGSRVKFLGNNTIGTAKDNGYPVIEDDVVVGCGARVLGPVRVGRGAIIGANAVVLNDIPAGAVAVGMPARALLPDDQQTSPHRRTEGADTVA
jgi:serine O-acetyltransferase